MTTTPPATGVTAAVAGGMSEPRIVMAIRGRMTRNVRGIIAGLLFMAAMIVPAR
jgi:hypothetical protein